jgi:hypothetical protein
MGMAELPVLATAAEAYDFCWASRVRFALLASPYVALLVAFRAGEQFSVTPNATFAVAAVAAYGFVLVVFAIAWHRAYLLPDSPVGIREVFRWHRRQPLFFLDALKVAPLYLALTAGWQYFYLYGGTLIVSIFPAYRRYAPDEVQVFSIYFDHGVPHSLGTMAVIGAAAGIFSYLYARIALVFPATAIDRRMSLRRCWRLTQGNGLRLAVVLLLSVLPFSLLVSLSQIGLSAAGMLRMTELVAHDLLLLAGTAVFVSALSASYRTLSRADPGSANETGPAA